MAAITVALAVERGLLDYSEKVSHYWPEFSENAKENIPVRYLFCHKSGLCGIKTPLKTGAFTDWNLICSELAKQSTFWEPGTAHGYHGLTYVFLIGELLRRIDGRTIGTYFREEIADPLDIDFWIGLPDSEFHRVSDIYPAKSGLIEKLLTCLYSR